MTLSAVVQHLAVLESCGLVRSEKVGRTRTCRLEPVGLQLAADWFAGQRAAWERRLDRLGEVLEADLAPKGRPIAPPSPSPPKGPGHMTSTSNRRTAEHGTFTITRTYPAPPERVFAAWSSRDARRAGSAIRPRRTAPRLPGRRRGDQQRRPSRGSWCPPTRRPYKDIVPAGADRLRLHDGGRRHADLRLGHHGRVRRRGGRHDADLHRTGRLPRRRRHARRPREGHGRAPRRPGGRAG